jgi:hypothetical protein
MFMVEPIEPAAIAARTRALRAGESAAERAIRQLGVLADLTDLGMDLARLTRVQAFDQAAACAAGAAPMAAQVGSDIGLTFTRIARCVRLTVALEASLAREFEDAERAAARADRPAPPPRPAPSAKAGLEPDVAAETGRPRRERTEADAEMGDPVDWPGDKPLAEVVAGVCAELGAPMNWSLWRDEPATPKAAEPLRPKGLDRDRPDPPRPASAARWRNSAAAVPPTPPTGSGLRLARSPPPQR